MRNIILLILRTSTMEQLTEMIADKEFIQSLSEDYREKFVDDAKMVMRERIAVMGTKYEDVALCSA